MRIAMCSAPAKNFRGHPGASTRRVMHRSVSSTRCAIISALRALWSHRRRVTARITVQWLRARQQKGQGARHLLQFRETSGGLHARDELLEIASRVAPLAWHVVIYFEAVDLPALWDFFTPLPTTVVADQMGRPDESKDVGRSEFALFGKFMREDKSGWSKVSCP